MRFGLMGGAMQAHGHGQFLLNLLVLGMGVQKAMDAARSRHLSGMKAAIEGAVPDSVRAALARMGHVVSEGQRSQMGGIAGDHPTSAWIRCRVGSAEGWGGGGAVRGLF
jgi:gamma-glutamyltranspeptidase/glutathione hydrolase